MAAPAESPRRRGHNRGDTLTRFAHFEQDYNQKITAKRANSVNIPESDIFALLDQADEKTQSQPRKRQTLKRIWQCSVCTFHNNSHMRYCEICGVMRDANSPEQVGSPVVSPEASPNPPRWNERESDLTAAIADPADMLSYVKANNKARPEQVFSSDHLAASIPHHRPSQSSPAVIGHIPSHKRTESIPHPLGDAEVIRTFDPLVHAVGPAPTGPPVQNGRVNLVFSEFVPAVSDVTPDEPPAISHRLSIDNLMAHNHLQPTFWTCSICTFAENSLDSPVCNVCGAIPPEAPPSPEPNSVETWEALGGSNAMTPVAAQRRVSRELDLIGGQEFQFPEAMAPARQAPPQHQPLGRPESPTQLGMPRGRTATMEADFSEKMPPEVRRRAQSSTTSRNRVSSPRAAANQHRGGFFKRVLGRFGRDGEAPDMTKQKSMVLPSEANDDAAQKPFSIATISPEKRQKLVRKLEKLDTKKDLLNYLEQTIAKVRDKLQKHVTCLLQYKKQLDKTRVEMEAESKRWEEFCIRPLERKAEAYFSNRILFYTTCHDVEKMYADCFSEKLKKLKHAKATIDRNKRHYSIDDMRMNIETAFDIAWRIRISDTVPEKQELLRDLRQIIDAEKDEYKALKALHDVEISMEQRTTRVKTFLEKTLLAVSERRRAVRRRAIRAAREVPNFMDGDDEVSVLSDEMGSVVSTGSADMDDDDNCFYHEYDPDKQDTFNCFLLDRRVREGRIVHKWLLRQENQSDDTSLESSSEFLRRLAGTLCNSYSLDDDIYYDCVQLFVYRCMFVHDRFAALLSGILHNETEIALNDEAFGRKTLWMRTLKQDQLGIEPQFRMEYEDSMMSILSAIDIDNDLDLAETMPPRLRGANLSRRKPSSLALVSGSDMPYAAAINIFGDIRKAVNPHEVLRILLSAVKCINSTASAYARDKGSSDFVITGDSLFPIVVYCVVQCGLEDPHKQILLLETMLPKQSTFGAGAFALSVIKAAVSYILQANPVDFGLPAEVEAF